MTNYLKKLRQKEILFCQKKIKSFKKSLHTNISKLLRYILFYKNYSYLWLKNNLVKIVRTRLLTFRFLSVVYFLVILDIIFISGWYINADRLSSEALTFFIAIAAMIGGIIAIIFPFKILIMQNAADNTSAGFYRTLGRDKRQDIVFFVIVLSVIVLFIFALTAFSYKFVFWNQKYDLLRIIFQLSLFIIGIDFYLIFYLFEILFKRIDPFSGISHIQKKVHNYLDDIHKRSEQYAELMILHPKTDRKISKNEVLASVFLSLSNDLQFISINLNYLFDYHDKTLSKNERTASLVILDVIVSILKKYFIIRKKSSILLPSGFYFVSKSDSQEFLEPHLASLVSVGEDYLKKEDSVGVRKIITLFGELVGYAGEIKFLKSRVPENPILMQTRGYLDVLLKSIMQKGFLEGMFQGAIVYKVIGAIIMRKKLIHELTPVFESLNKIAYSALLTKQDVVVSEVIKSYSALIRVLVEDDWLFGEKLSLLLEHLQETVLYSFASHKSRSIPHARMQQEIAKPYVVLTDLIIQKAKSVSTITDVGKKAETKSLVIDATKEMYTSLRFLSENLKNADSLLIGILGNIIRLIGSLLISLTADSHWNDAKHALVREGKAYLNLPWWFTDGVTKIDNSLSFDELPEAVSKIGLVALDVNQETIVEDALEIITDLAKTMLTKEDPPSIGHTQPRIMVLACYLGIYALKLRITTIVSKLKTFITEFEQAYQQKYFTDPRADLISSPRRNQLMIEVHNLTTDTQEHNRISDPIPSTKDLLLEKINTEDVKKFIMEVWGVEIN